MMNDSIDKNLTLNSGDEKDDPSVASTKRPNAGRDYGNVAYSKREVQLHLDIRDRKSVV